MVMVMVMAEGPGLICLHYMHKLCHGGTVALPLSPCGFLLPTPCTWTLFCPSLWCVSVRVCVCGSLCVCEWAGTCVRMCVCA